MRRILFALLGGLLLTVLVAGCGGGSTASSSNRGGGGGGDSGGGETGPDADLVEISPATTFIAPHDPITIYFHYKMDPASLVTDVGTEREWVDENSTVSLTPSIRWPSGSPSTIYIYCEDFENRYYLEGAIQYDVPLEPTVSVSPSGSFPNISDLQAITLSFSDPMDPASFAASGSMASQATTAWSSDRRTATVTPASFWPNSTQTFGFQATSTTYGDTVIYSPANYSVYGTAPTVTKSQSGGFISTDQVLSFTFSEPMDTATVVLSGPMASETGSGVWSAENTVLTFTPTDTWSYGDSWLAVSLDDLSGITVDTGGFYTVVDFGSGEDQALETPAEPSNQFGASVAADGMLVVVGAAGEGAIGSSSAYHGAVYVYEFDGSAWGLQQKLLPDDSHATQYFGSSVAISGDTLAAAAVGESAVYIFITDGTTWTQQARLTITDPTYGAISVQKIALSGDTLVAVRDDLSGPAGNRQGVAYIFSRNAGTWSQQATLRGSDTTANAAFGRDVSVNGSTIVVGAAGMKAAYVFTGSGSSWTEQAILSPAGASAYGYVNSVGIDGGTIIVGLAGLDAVYVYEGSGSSWTQNQQLTAHDLADAFGSAVAIRGNRIMVSAPSGEPGGAAYHFTRSAGTWTETEKLQASDPNPSSHTFGYSVALASGVVVVADYLHEIVSGKDFGTVFVYNRP